MYVDCARSKDVRLSMRQKFNFPKKKNKLVPRKFQRKFSTALAFSIDTNCLCMSVTNEGRIKRRENLCM